MSKQHLSKSLGAKTPVEIKAHTGTPTSLEVVDAFDDFMHAFEAFKETNDERLSQIEQRVGADVVTVEKMNRIERSLDNQQSRVDTLLLKAKRPALGGSIASSTEALEHKRAFHSYVRHGAEGNLKALEAKAWSVASLPDGGYLVPEELETEITRRLSVVSPIRSIAGIKQVTGSMYKRPFAINGAETGWVGETDPRPETLTPTLEQLEFPTMELYAMPAATATLLDDAATNVDEWIAEEVETAFAEQEGIAFISGDGVNKPRGFLDYPTLAEQNWAWGNLGYVPTGTAGDFAAADPFDSFIFLTYALRAPYRQNASWVMNRGVQAQVRRFKDADGNYIWQPPTGIGAQASILNHPIVEAEDMPNIGTDTFSVAFGDFNRGYLIVDRLGIRVLRDPFSKKPYVLFYTTKRVGGGVLDYNAIKLLKFGVS
ncbi:MAG: phage major capsid protein [Hyphomicrobiales bacterium]|nr:MAG: phage major capsid protein [Hyphomicrobiales bacterium]